MHTLRMHFFMSFQFSKTLIEETILCFKEEDGLDISETTANEYLMSLSNLYLAYSMPSSTPSDNLLEEDVDGKASVELDSNHT